MIARRRLFGMFLAASVGALPAAAYAEDGSNDHDSGEHADDHGGDRAGGGNTADDDHDGDNDQNLALDAVQNSKAASLREILSIVNEKYKGEVVHVSLQRAGTNVTYNIRLLDPHNNLVEVQVNAINRAIILTKGQ
jgi:uncharacterized membrane protein YkoI